MSSSKSKQSKQYVLYRVDESGADTVSAVKRVKLDKEVTLVQQSGDSLLVTGNSRAVGSVTKDLLGWDSEPNYTVRGNV